MGEIVHRRIRDDGEEIDRDRDERMGYVNSRSVHCVCGIEIVGGDR